MSKNRYSKLISNSVLFAIANLGTKMMQFIMVPLYTYALSTRQYGIVDLLLTTVTMMTPIVSLSIFDAVFRFSMDKDEDLIAVFSNGVFITLLGTIVFLMLSPLNIWVKIPYYSYFVVMLIVSAANSLLQNFARSTGFVVQFALSGVINALLIVAFNIVLLIVLHMGIMGYILSIIGAGVITLGYLIVSVKAWHYFDIWKIKRNFSKRMLRYSVPLIPNSFSWWFTNDANKYFILFFVGAAGNGLYAVANKIPSILTIFWGIFTQAWQLSAVEEFESSDKDGFYSKIFNVMLFVSMVGISGLLVVLRPFMNLYAAPAFYSAWEFVPFLLVAAVFSNLSGFLGTIFLAAKRTRLILTTTIVGMLINLLVNICLIPFIGINGAGVGSALGFAAVATIRLIQSRRFVQVRVDKYLLSSSMLITLIMIIVEELSQSQLWTVFWESLLFMLLLVVGKSYIKSIVALAKSAFSKRRDKLG